MEIFREGRERAFESAMQKRHQIALTGVRLEKMVEEDAGFLEMQSFVDQQDIPRTTKEKLSQVVNAFESQRRSLDDIQRRLEERMGFSIDEDPERAGQVFFQAHYYRDGGSRGAVVLTRERDYFKVKFENGEDLARRFPNRPGESGGIAGVCALELTPEVLDPNYRHRYEEKLRRVYGSGGDRVATYRLYTHEGVEGLKAEGFEAPSEVVFSENVPIMCTTDNQELQEAVYAHERQHLIYREFADPDYPLDRIRDEFLAYIREGRYDMARDFFDLELYWYLGDGMDENEKDEVRNCLARIYVEIQQVPEIFASREGRALMTYHLIDLSLEKMPERIALISKFYEKALRPLAEFRPPDTANYQDSHITTVSDIRYGFLQFGEPMQSLANQMVAAYDHWCACFEQASTESLLRPGSESLSVNLFSLKRAHAEAIETLQLFLERSAGEENLYKEEAVL